MDKLVLIGHSRDGEASHRAAIDSSTTATSYKIDGIVSYGPSAIGGQVNPSIQSATILPTCDGDLFNLIGQAYIDRYCCSSSKYEQVSYLRLQVIEIPSASEIGPKRLLEHQKMCWGHNSSSQTATKRNIF
jgi:hypothetical protein